MLKYLRANLKKNAIDGWLQNRGDQFLNEYIAPDDDRLTPLSGFSGSSGLALVLANDAFLLIDGRYDTQARAEVDKNWHILGPTEMKKINCQDFPDVALSLKKKLTIGFPADSFSYRQIMAWQKKLKNSPVRLKAFQKNLNPPLDKKKTIGKIFNHDIKYAGLSRQKKLAQLRQILKQKNIHQFIIGNNANLSWLLNLRGDMIPYNPIITAIGLVGKTSCHVFLPDNMLPQNFDKNHITIHPLSSWSRFIKNLPSHATIAMDDGDSNYQLINSVPPKKRIFMPDPISKMKSSKNKIEMDGAKLAHLYDGIAMVRFLYWLDMAMKQSSPLDEINIAEKLWWFRQQNKNCVMPSFATIAAITEHAALPHYQAKPHSRRHLANHDILLLDSGAHYFFGTTDITRTIVPSPLALSKNHWGDDFARHYTLVLKGHLAIARARFPKHTLGSQLDPLARQYLWQFGLDYNHSTGHGIGHFLSVHESPPHISAHSQTAVCPAHLTSNEPAFYQTDNKTAAGVYGIRIENIELCKIVGRTKHGDDILGFETLTLCPIDTTPLHHQNNLAWLNDDEKNQLNLYHQKVKNTLSPHLSPDEKKWLSHRTIAI
ncbi:MAG: M24 family metallopeptidase [Alphaproteobacteria bacterium]